MIDFHIISIRSLPTSAPKLIAAFTEARILKANLYCVIHHLSSPFVGAESYSSLCSLQQLGVLGVIGERYPNFSEKAEEAEEEAEEPAWVV